TAGGGGRGGGARAGPDRGHRCRRRPVTTCSRPRSTSRTRGRRCFAKGRAAAPARASMERGCRAARARRRSATPAPPRGRATAAVHTAPDPPATGNPPGVLASFHVIPVISVCPCLSVAFIRGLHPWPSSVAFIRGQNGPCPPAALHP